RTAAADGGRDLVQKRVIERPTVRVRQRHVDVNAGSTTRDSPAHRRLPDAIRERKAKGQLGRRRLEEARVDADGGQVGARRKVDGVERIAAARLEIDGLPHAARRAVALLALELEGMRRVV